MSDEDQQIIFFLSKMAIMQLYNWPIGLATFLDGSNKMFKNKHKKGTDKHTGGYCDLEAELAQYVNAVETKKIYANIMV